MNDKMRFYPLLALTLVLIASGCTRDEAPAVTTTLQPTTTVEETSTVQSTTSTVEPTTTLPAGPEVREFTIMLQRNSIVPNVLTVARSDTVILHLTGSEISFSFGIRGYDISQKVYPQRYETVTFVANESGNFTMYYTRKDGSPQWLGDGLLIVE
ncbi:MAG: hypothetical protein V1921_04400 [Candidatus Altiarchaeota archaeon]